MWLLFMLVLEQMGNNFIHLVIEDVEQINQ